MISCNWLKLRVHVRVPVVVMDVLCNRALMPNNFRKTAVLKKIWIVNKSFTPKDSTGKNWGRYMQLHALESLFYFLIGLSVIISSTCRLKFPGKKCKQIYGKSKASVWGNLSTVIRPPKFVSKILCCVSLVYNSYFFSEQPFYGNYKLRPRPHEDDCKRKR